MVRNPPTCIAAQYEPMGQLALQPLKLSQSEAFASEQQGLGGVNTKGLTETMPMHQDGQEAPWCFGGQSGCVGF